MTNPVGDGTTNDIAALQSIIDASDPYGTLELNTLDTYRLVIDGSVPERGLVLKPNMTLNLNGAVLNFECHHDVYCVRPTSGSKIVNGRVNLTVSDSLTSEQGVYHAPVGIGSAYGEITSLVDRGPYIEAEDWLIEDLKISSIKSAQGWGICGLGGFQSGTIRHVEIMDSPTLWGGIDFDWGTLGIPLGIPQNRINFGNGRDLGSFRGVHPKNILIENNRIGRLTNPLSEAFRMSGCDAFTLNNNFVKYCGASGFSHYGGDDGHEWCAYGANRYQAYMNTVCRNLTIAEVGPTGSAIRIDAWADNIAREPNYTPLTPAIYPTNLLIDGLVADGAGSIGLKIGSMAGGTIRRARLNWFHQGISFQPGISRHVIEDSVFHGQDSTAIPYKGILPSGVTMNRVVFEY